MAERLGLGQRQSGMKVLAIGTLLVVSLVLAGCGDQGDDSPRASSTPTSSWCRSSDGGEVRLASPDLDGDGTADPVVWTPASGSCPATLSSSVEGLESAPTLAWDPQPTARDASVVRLPGRTGDLLVLLQQHPRGGFQAHLYGYDHGDLEELAVDGKPILPFVATDALADPVSATCVEGGFEVLQARAHAPVGVVPAWDVHRTTYAVDGNAVTEGPTTEVADNVLDEDLHKSYRDLVDHSLFADCSAAG
jgi:hypothetical protein